MLFFGGVTATFAPETLPRTPKKERFVFQPSFFKGEMFDFRGLLHLEGFSLMLQVGGN